MKDIYFVDKQNASYDTSSLDPTPDVPICPLVDNCFFNYYNVSVMITTVWISGDIDALHQLSLVIEQS